MGSIVPFSAERTELSIIVGMCTKKKDQKPQTRVEQAAYIVERVKSLGVRINSSSRLMEMLRTLESGNIEWDDRRFPIALESIRDMYQLRLIVDEMDAHRDNPRFRASVQKLLLDAALPQDSTSGTLGRNTQFELYLAAIALRGGLLPVEYDEPDVTCTVGNAKFAIAAKRLKSLKQFERRVKEGADQIRRAKLPGIIALDLTIARNPANRPITSGIESQLSVALAHAKNSQLFGQNERRIDRWVAASGVRGLLVFEFTFRVSPNRSSWLHDGMMCWFPTTYGAKRAEMELALFQRYFLQGMPDLNDLTTDQVTADGELGRDSNGGK